MLLCMTCLYLTIASVDKCIQRGGGGGGGVEKGALRMPRELSPVEERDVGFTS